MMKPASGHPSLFADKTDILAKNTERARLVTSNNNVLKSRIRSAKNDSSTATIHKLERGVVVKQHGRNFPISNIRLAVYDRDIARKDPCINHAFAFDAESE